jgi:hypothetical protein
MGVNKRQLHGIQESPIAYPERIDGFCQPPISPHAVKAIVDRSPFLQLLGCRRQYPIMNLYPRRIGVSRRTRLSFSYRPIFDQSDTSKKLAGAADLIVLC